MLIGNARAAKQSLRGGPKSPSSASSFGKSTSSSFEPSLARVRRGMKKLNKVGARFNAQEADSPIKPGPIRAVIELPLNRPQVSSERSGRLALRDSNVASATVSAQRAYGLAPVCLARSLRCTGNGAYRLSILLPHAHAFFCSDVLRRVPFLSGFSGVALHSIHGKRQEAPIGYHWRIRH